MKIFGVSFTMLALLFVAFYIGTKYPGLLNFTKAA